MDLITDKAEKRKHIKDWWPASMKWTEEQIDNHLPAGIVFPKSVDEIKQAVKYASEHKLAIVTYGGASGVLGGIVPEQPSLTVDMQELKGIINFDENNHLVTAYAGTLGGEIEKYLNKKGYTLGHYPQSLYLASIGGLVATKSAGTFSSKYGNIENIVQSLEVVLPNGEIFVNRNIPRSATGPYIPNLFVGSEGTLGIITKVTLKIWKIPETKEFRGIEFDSIEDAIFTSREFYRRDIVPAVVRIYNPAEAQNLYSTINYQSNKVLMIIGLVGAKTVVPEVLKQVLITAKKRTGHDLGASIGNNWERDRYNAAWLKEGNDSNTKIADAIEVSGNWTMLPKMFHLVSERLENKVDKLWAHCSHCYPSGANIYFIIFATGKDAADTLAKYNEIWKIVMDSVHEVGGSGAHHHGIGRQRLPWFNEEVGPVSFDLLKKIKSSFDPKGMFNPGILNLKNDEKE